MVLIDVQLRGAWVNYTVHSYQHLHYNLERSGPARWLGAALQQQERQHCRCREQAREISMMTMAMTCNG